MDSSLNMVVDYSTNLLRNVHEVLASPADGETVLVKGNYEYWHYGCDGFNDKGWGCGYRTLQTICSWIKLNKNVDTVVPSIRSIQETLVKLEDKERSFLGSRDWIGSVEVCLIIDELFGVPGKIVHVTAGKDLFGHVDMIKTHFDRLGSPIMMGGDQDCSSKCIVGVHIGKKDKHLLIVDPHFVGRPKNPEQLRDYHWVKWQNVKDFVDSSFYNLCLPQAEYSSRSSPGVDDK